MRPGFRPKRPKAFLADWPSKSTAESQTTLSTGGGFAGAEPSKAPRRRSPAVRSAEHLAWQRMCGTFARSAKGLPPTAQKVLAAARCRRHLALPAYGPQKAPVGLFEGRRLVATSRAVGSGQSPKLSPYRSEGPVLAQNPTGPGQKGRRPFWPELTPATVYAFLRSKKAMAKEASAPITFWPKAKMPLFEPKARKGTAKNRKKTAQK